MDGCDLCSRVTAGASMQGGTVRLGVAASVAGHDWARSPREAAVCPTRVCEAAAAKASDPDLRLFRDFLLCPLWHPLARAIIAWLCDHPTAAGWTAEEVETEAARQVYITAIDRYLAHADHEAAVAAEQQAQDERVQAVRKQVLGRRSTNRRRS